MFERIILITQVFFPKFDKSLYDRDDNNIWVRPEKMFLEEIPERPDNITGQKHRFELCKDIEKNYLPK